jgi:hypothetical protein
LGIIKVVLSWITRFNEFSEMYVVPSSMLIVLPGSYHDRISDFFGMNAYRTVIRNHESEFDIQTLQKSGVKRQDGRSQAGQPSDECYRHEFRDCTIIMAQNGFGF